MASQPISLPATLSPAQMKVVAALAQGASVAEAARAARLHRSTVYQERPAPAPRRLKFRLLGFRPPCPAGTSRAEP